MYKAKKTLGALGMNYEKIHVFSNYCHSYRQEYANATKCPKCGNQGGSMLIMQTMGKKHIPKKVVWYFPPIPRFKRLFQSIDKAKNLIWHAKERVMYGKLRHLVESPA